MNKKNTPNNRNRLLLESMGIGIWVLRSSETSLINSKILWRDQEMINNQPENNSIDTNANIPLELKFKIDSLITENCAVIVDLNQLNTEDMQLWGNIKKSTNHTTLTLEYPITALMGKTNAALVAYIRGFFSQIGDKKMISLGEIPFVSDLMIDVKKTPALSEYHASPNLKTKLWKTIK